MADADDATPLPGLVEGLIVPLRTSLTALVDAGIERGDVRNDIDVNLTINTLRGAVTMHLTRTRHHRTWSSPTSPNS
jgi:hypothetical protein